MSDRPPAKQLAYWDGAHAVYLSERYGQSQRAYRIVHVPSGHEQSGYAWGGLAHISPYRHAQHLLDIHTGTAITAPIDENEPRQPWNDLDMAT